MTKELIKKYADIIYPNDKRMNDYVVKTTSEVIETSAGYLEFEKPDIKTRFCFGHGQYGITTTEETNSACNMAAHARTSEQYFIDENLEDINDKIKRIKEADKVYLIQKYYKTEKIRDIRTDDYFRYYPEEMQRLNAQEATVEDIKLILETLEAEKAKFLKRLNTYLKRYGLSKIHSWTYLVD